MEVVFLGTGTSHGVPVIGCHCSVCRSKNPKNKRTRTSVVVKSKQATILVDASPEMRLQLIANKIDHIDAMVVTHAHADHISGLDDVRIFSERENRHFPIYGSSSVLKELKQRFDYAFKRTQKGGAKPKLKLVAVDERFKINGFPVIPVPVLHGRLKIYGYRFGMFSYLTDVSDIPESSYRLLEGIDVLVLDALRHEEHPTHFNLEQAIKEAMKIKATQTFFTHMCHLLEHVKTNRQLPKTMELAYDGLCLKVEE